MNGLIINNKSYKFEKVKEGLCELDCDLFKFCQREWNSCPVTENAEILKGETESVYLKSVDITIQEDRPIKGLIELTVMPDGQSNFKPYKALFSINNIEEIAGHDVKFFNYAQSIRVEEDYETIKQKIKDAERG